jgi:hypothetical protein
MKYLQFFTSGIGHPVFLINDMLRRPLFFYLPIFHFHCLHFLEHSPEEDYLPIFHLYCLPLSEHPPEEYCLPIFDFHCYPFEEEGPLDSGFEITISPINLFNHIKSQISWRFFLLQIQFQISKLNSLASLGITHTRDNCFL